MSARISLRLLQIVVGAVLFFYSAQLAFERVHAAHHLGILALGVVEAVAALIFLFAASIGGPLLLATFAVAAAIHILHGQAGHIGTLLIYAAATIAVMSGRRG